MWLIPSRERPHKVKRFIRAYHATEADTPFIVIVDETDPKLSEYRSLRCPLLVYPGETPGLGLKVRYAYSLIPNRRWYGIFPDDCEPITEGWDRALIEAALPDKVAYCLHGVERLDFPALPCIGAELIREIGYILPEQCPHYTTDSFWRQLAKQTGRLVWVPEHTVQLTDYITDEPWDDVKKRQKAKQPEEARRFRKWQKMSEWRSMVRRLRVGEYKPRFGRW